LRDKGDGKVSMKYVVDTNIINRLIDGLLSTSDLPSDGEFVATHIQNDELSKTSDSNRRGLLLQKFSTLVDAVIPTESTVLGISTLGQSKISDDTLYQTLKAGLDSKNKGKENNAQDALIAEVGIKQVCTLLTADGDLAEVAKEHGCLVMFFK
jgi:rRNA-processing protein FCF1